MQKDTQEQFKQEFAIVAPIPYWGADVANEETFKPVSVMYSNEFLSGSFVNNI